jgi:hypothetical protein
MVSIDKIWKTILLGLVTLLISWLGTPTSSEKRPPSNSDDTDSDYHLFI